MRHIIQPSILLPVAAFLTLAFGCSRTPDAVAPPSTQELASRAVEVDSGEPLDEGVTDEFTFADEEAEAPSMSEDAFASPEPTLVTSWTVRRGESLAHFARWAELPVEAVAEASGVSLSSALQVGEAVVIPGDGAVRAKVEQARQRHHRVRAEAYLATRGGAVGTSFHTVRTGETGWSVATRELGLPVWLVEAYNPAVNLERLRPGEQLLYPVVSDTVAALDDDAASGGASTPASNEAP